MSSSTAERKIRDVRDVWACGNSIDVGNGGENKENPEPPEGGRSKHKYKTLERHLSMKKTIRKKMMRDLREIGDAAAAAEPSSHHQTVGFLEQIRNDQPPPANIDKPSLWRRLTKGWGHS